MNDIVLLSLLNLFALFNTEKDIDSKSYRSVLIEYLNHHFGVRDVKHYLEFYDNLQNYYRDNQNIDLNSITKDISEKVKERISTEDRVLMVLRFIEMQFVCNRKAIDNDGLRIIQESFEIKDHTYESLFSFIEGNPDSEAVNVIPYGRGRLRILFLGHLDLLLFAYDGKEKVIYNDVPVRSGYFVRFDRSGVLKCKSDKPLYHYNLMLPFRNNGSNGINQLKLRGDNIEFSFKKGEGGVHGFTFNLYGGELVAVMGGSGTGKSTLLSLLNGTLAPQEGRISINGHDINESGAKALIGFVPQDNLLIEELTVYQNLMYTARFCFDGLSEKELDIKVMNMLHELGLENARDLVVGSPVKKFISGGQRRRLNIALELIREPEILFLDEPTSGLSSADSEAVMNLLKEQAYRGKLIITIIHQPSSDIFKMFDRLWVLDAGGYPVYDGNPIEAVTYFKTAAGYADAQTSTCPACGNVDPDIILSIIDEKVIDNSGVLTDKRKTSPQEWHEMYLKNVPPAKNKVEDLPGTDQHRPSRLKQVIIFLSRNFKAKTADRQWLLITLLQAPLLAVICAVLTHYAPLEGYCVMDNKNLVSYFFMAVIVATFLGMSSSAEEIIKDRALLKRESFLDLSYQSYIWSKIIFMAGVSAVQTLLFILVGNSIMGLNCLFCKWWLILFSAQILAALTGLLLSQCLSSVVAIYISIPVLLIPQILLCGLVVKFPDLTPRSTTGNVPVIGEVIPSRWAFEALAVTYFTDNDFEKYFFKYDKVRYQARYYESAYLYELESQLETWKKKSSYGEDAAANMSVIKTSLPRLLNVCGLPEYQGEWNYAELRSLFKNAADRLSDRSSEASRCVNLITDALAEEIGTEGLVSIKRNNHNLQLERQIVNTDAECPYKIIDNQIVANAGFIYLDSVTHNGRAPFYSSSKFIGSLEVPTLWFNLAVILLMSIFLTICLLFRFFAR